MKIGVLGTGVVGESIASALIKKDHHVMMGSRAAGGEKAKAWVKKGGKWASEGSFDDAARFGDLLFICLNGEHAQGIVQGLSPEHLHQKIIVDVTNPLDFSKGTPPEILEEYSHVSLAEKIQEAAPNAYIIKALNTVNYKLMVDARVVNGGNHTLFICGNHTDSKNKVKHFLVDNFYWKPDGLIDLGDITSARAIEGIVPFWVLIWKSLGTSLFNFRVVH